MVPSSLTNSRLHAWGFLERGAPDAFHLQPSVGELRGDGVRAPLSLRPCFECHSKLMPMDGYPDLVEHYGGYAMILFDGNPDNGQLWKVVEFLRG